MKEFESERAAAEYFRGVLGYGKEWIALAKDLTPRLHADHRRIVFTRSEGTASHISYLLKPKVRRYRVLVAFTVEATHGLMAERIVEDKLHIGDAWKTVSSEEVQ